MANFKQVNAAIKAKFPKANVIAVRGAGYVYFSSSDAHSWPESIICHPVNTSTETLIKMCIEQIEAWLPAYEESKAMIAAAKQSHAEHTAAQPVADDLESLTPRNVPTPEQFLANVDTVMLWLRSNTSASDDQIKRLATGISVAFGKSNSETLRNGATLHSLAGVDKPAQTVAIPKIRRNLKTDEDGTFTYSRKQHEAIQAIMSYYLKGIEERGRHNLQYTFLGVANDNSTFIPVRHLDTLCGLEHVQSESFNIKL